MKCPNPKCKGGRRLETKKTFDELDRVRRVKACLKCGGRFETIELHKGFYENQLAEGERQAQDLSRIIGEREDSLMEVREAVQVLIRQIPAETLEVMTTPEKGRSLLPAKRKRRTR